MLSIPDMALLGAAALLLFGPDQLPRVARRAGNVMREIQNTSHAFIREMERAADLQDEAAKPHQPAAYETAADDAFAAYDAPTMAMEAVEPPAPDPERPDPVGEKLAEPRAAAGWDEDVPPAPAAPAQPSAALKLIFGDPLPDGGANGVSHAAQPAPEDDHPAHL